MEGWMDVAVVSYKYMVVLSVTSPSHILHAHSLSLAYSLVTENHERIAPTIYHQPPTSNRLLPANATQYLPNPNPNPDPDPDQ